jgi:hypothetical protein
MAVGYYVTLRRGQRTAFLAGPFDTKDEAERMVQPAVAEAAEVDPFTHFDLHGTARVEAARLPLGKLNTRLGLPRTRHVPDRREGDEAEDATIRRYAIHRHLTKDVVDAERHEDAAARLDRALRYSGGRSRHRPGSLLGRTGDRSARRRGER